MTFPPKFITNRVDSYKEKTIKTANDTIDTIIKCCILALISFTVVWIAVFLYVAFYYTYVPSIEHVKPVNLQFEPCEEKKGLCSFPKAHVELTKSNQILMVGQPYRISLTLDMPESPTNKELGMFMVCGRLVSKGGVVVSYSCRSAMLRYHSSLVRTLTTLAFAPLYITKTLEEKQILIVDLFPSYEEDQNYPLTDVYIEIKSHVVEVYSSKLSINAHLTGLRYMMFHWPVLSALFGISFNLIAIVFIALLSWCQLYTPYNKYGAEYIYQRIKKSVSPERLRGTSKEDSEEDSESKITDEDIEEISSEKEILTETSEKELLTELQKLETSTEA